MRRHMRLLAGFVVLQPALGASAEACPASAGPGCAEDSANSDDFKCIKWRQTGGCSPRGPRERHGDKSCQDLIPTGSSGYCQCGVGDSKLRAREVTCDHRPFTCETECLQFHRYTCVSWRQTGGCSSDGEREPAQDKSCDDTINARMSGFCECGGGRIIRKPGCEHGDFAEPFNCRDECAHEPDLYEELGLDSGATEKAIKQAFRKLSLVYHPDKTRNDAGLTARFASIREAYDILNDQEQRAFYDAAGLKLVYEARNQKVEKGPAAHLEIRVSLEDFYNGAEMQQSVGRKVICRGCAGASTPRCNRCHVQCAHEIELRNVQMGPMVMQQQVERPSKEKCRIENVKLLVAVERGMSPGDTVTFKGRGEQQPKKVPGDVVLSLKAVDHKTFRRLGADLHTEMEITLLEALLGFERTITHLDGRSIMFTVDAVTQPFGTMRIAGEGMPHRGDPTQRGDLYVKFRFAMPKDGHEWLRSSCPSCSKR